MFDMARWTVVKNPERRRFLLGVEGVPDEIRDAPEMEILCQLLDFCEGGLVVEFTAPGDEPRVFLMSYGHAMELLGDPPSILEGNSLLHLKLTTENVLSYFRYFWAMIQGSAYPRLVETADEFLRPGLDLIGAIRPAKFVGEMGDKFICECTMVHDEQLARMRFIVGRDGGMDGADLEIFGKLGGQRQH